MIKFVAACAQFAITPMQPRENVQKAIHWIERAVRETNARLIIVPETVTTGFVPGIPAAELWDVVGTLPGALSAPIAETAKKLGVFVVFPTYERGTERGVVYNSAALIDPHGEVIGVYRKTHLFPTERKSAGGWSTPGNKPVVVETELGSIGLMICYDGDFPELARCEAITSCTSRSMKMTRYCRSNGRWRNSKWMTFTARPPACPSQDTSVPLRLTASYSK